MNLHVLFENQHTHVWLLRKAWGVLGSTINSGKFTVEFKLNDGDTAGVV